MKKSSKEKILEVARELFANNGFKGTSVRMISDRAGVNVASVNYYFSSKEALFKAVMVEEAIAVMTTVSKVVGENQKLDFVDLSCKLFEAFYKNPDEIISCMKLVLSFEKKSDKDQPIDESQKEAIRCSHKILTTSLEREYGDKLPEELKEWAADSMFLYMIHLILMMNSGFVHEVAPEKDRSFEALLPKIQMTAEALVLRLKEEMK